jgi:endonuclease YncB( thermonuclease family)
MQSKCVFVTALILAVFYLKPSFADAIISGPACIIDGNTIQVGGKMKAGACWGGINVRLHGSVAPDLKDKCPRPDGTDWDCGQVAKGALQNLIRVKSVTCYHIDGEFDGVVPVATCLSGHRDLALELVVKGMAKALHDQSNRYELEERDAKQSKRGIWQ